MNSYTHKQAAAELHITVEQLEQKRKRGKISFSRMARGVYAYTQAHIDEYYAANEVKRCAASQNSSESPPPTSGMSSISTEAEVGAALRAVQSARKTMKQISSLPPSRSNARNQQPESRIN